MEGEGVLQLYLNREMGIKVINKVNQVILSELNEPNMNTNPTIRPTPPNAPAKMMRGNRNIRIVEDIFTVGVVKEASADSATAISKMVLVKAASTDA